MRQSVIVHHVLSPDLEHLSWEPFHPGVEVSWIYREDGDNGSAAAFLRYQPGAAIPQHLHTGFENILILSGSQTDRNGRHSAGTLVINQPGTSHDVVSDEGCVVLITWQKPVVL